MFTFGMVLLCCWSLEFRRGEGRGTSMEVHEEDRVIKEMDLFVSSTMAQQVSLLQFPLISKRVVPGIRQVQKPDDKNGYILEIGPEDEFAGNEMREYQVLAEKVATQQPFAIAVIKEGQIHLTPISAIYQAKPLNKDANEQKRDDLTAISITEGINTKDFVAQNSDIVASDLRVSSYRDSLKGSSCDFSTDLIKMIDDNNIHTRPPREQIYYLLVKRQVIRLSDISKEYHLKEYEPELIEVLLRYAYYVQGRWVVKSELIEGLDKNLRIIRNIGIVIFANHKNLPPASIELLCKTFELTKRDLNPAFSGFIKVNKGAANFKYTPSPEFGQTYKDQEAKALVEIEKLKEQICLLLQKPDFFSDFFANSDLMLKN